MYEATSLLEFLAVGLGVSIIASAAYLLGSASSRSRVTAMYAKNNNLKMAVLQFLATCKTQPTDRDAIKNKLEKVLDLIKEDVFDE